MNVFFLNKVPPTMLNCLFGRIGCFHLLLQLVHERIESMRILHISSICRSTSASKPAKLHHHLSNILQNFVKQRDVNPTDLKVIHGFMHQESKDFQSQDGEGSYK